MSEDAMPVKRDLDGKLSADNIPTRAMNWSPEPRPTEPLEVKSDKVGKLSADTIESPSLNEGLVQERTVVEHSQMRLEAKDRAKQMHENSLVSALVQKRIKLLDEISKIDRTIESIGGIDPVSVVDNPFLEFEPDKIKNALSAETNPNKIMLLKEALEARLFDSPDIVPPLVVDTVKKRFAKWLFDWAWRVLRG